MKEFFIYSIMKKNHNDSSIHRVVIIGGGFGGLYAAKRLGKAPVEVTLIDKRNFHLFQPLLYQVATGGLSPGDIASPLRAVLNRHKNTRVIMGEVTNIDPLQQIVYLGDETYGYDTLIVAVGVRHHYFENDHWEALAPGLKTIEDALEIRQRIFQAFEMAEKETDPARCEALLTFVVIGGGPTGVELAGALGELAHFTLKKDFRRINPAAANIILLEGGKRILPNYPEKLAEKAQKSLQKLGVTIHSNTLVTDMNDERIIIKSPGGQNEIRAKTILWAAGVRASALSPLIAEKTGAKTDGMGRVYVEPDLSIKEFPNIFIIGDLANFSCQTGIPLPGVSPVAMQQGRYAARLIKRRWQGKNLPAFRYFNKGNLAVIGRNAAVADFGFLQFSGWLAWLIWVFVHIAYLIEFDNKILVLFRWAIDYFTRKRGARLITGERY
jgi:NADH dehydrogenase